MRPKKLQDNHISEAVIVDQVTNFLSSEGYRIWHEVPNMGQSVDIIAMRGKQVICVEAKKSDWQRALNQCRTHEQVADYIGIAIGTVLIPTTFLKCAKDLGYGIIHYKRLDNHCEWILKPCKNKWIWTPQRQRLEANLKDINYVC